jgi:hypothetical protein
MLTQAHLWYRQRKSHFKQFDVGFSLRKGGMQCGADGHQGDTRLRTEKERSRSRLVAGLRYCNVCDTRRRLGTPRSGSNTGEKKGNSSASGSQPPVDEFAVQAPAASTRARKLVATAASALLALNSPSAGSDSS